MISLPNEITYMIAKDFDAGPLAALSATSRTFHRIFNHLLYRYNAQFQDSSAVFAAIDKCTDTNIALGTLRTAYTAGAHFGERRVDSIRNIFPRHGGHFAGPGVVKNEELAITPLHLAAAKGLDEIVCFFLEHDVLIDSLADELKWTPLFVAIYYRKASTAKLLIDRGASPAPRGYSYNALHLAAAAGLQDIATYLVRDRGRDVNAGDRNGDTPLIYAILSPRTAGKGMMRRLIDHGADPNKATCRNSRLLTPLKLACLLNFPVGLELLACGADAKGSGDVNIADQGIPDPPGPLESALTAAVRRQRGWGWKAKADLVGKLLSLGADPNKEVAIQGTRWRGPLLFKLVCANYKREAEYLLGRGGVDVDKHDSDGRTTLTWTLLNRPEMVPLLLQHGARPQDVAIKKIMDTILTLPPPCYPGQVRLAISRYPGLLQAFKALYDHCSRVPSEDRDRAINIFLANSPPSLVCLAEETTWEEIPSQKGKILQKLIEYQNRFWTMPSEALWAEG